MRISLSVKFNLTFITIFAVGFASLSWLAHELLQKTAVEETLQNARELMASANAAQNYTATQITPLLQTQMKYSFVPQSVPAFSAIEMLTSLEERLPGYSFRSTVLDPTNPRDRPTEWEAAAIRKLHDKPELEELIEVRNTSNGPSLSVAHPIRIDDAACMACHGSASQAPKTLTDKYGPNNGFNWPKHDVIGADIVSVPMAVPIARGEALFKMFTLSLIGVFGVALLALNVLVHRLVTRRICALAHVADEISLGKLDGTQFVERGGDEIALLAVSFGRMKTSLVEAFKMLDAEQSRQP
ncbi:DUF3365 domain-containing protein [Trinickia sp. LjRoot230]|uniref:Tll0287-like domain-containing protein n=1 Tax=Trinickia sp. LjRoot230 TaxID=3342288 RepID=UPI003ECD5ABF